MCLLHIINCNLLKMTLCKMLDEKDTDKINIGISQAAKHTEINFNSEHVK